jgi:phosphoglycolate phosphatase
MSIFFDLDGPILDASERYFRVHQDIIEQYGGRSMDKETYWQFKRDRRPLSTLLGMIGFNASEQIYRMQWVRKIELLKYLQHDTVIHGAREQLEKLKQHHTLILVTLRQRPANLGRQLEYLKIDHYFTAILSTNPCGVNGWETKKQLIAESGFPVENALIVGDTEIDIRAGKALGLKTVAVLSGIRNRERLAEEHPDFIVGGMNALSQIIKENWAENYG